MVRRSYVTVFTVLTAMTFLCVLASISGAAPRNTTLVSVDSSGTQATGGSGSPSISDDGRYVAFTSNATNLVVDDTNSRTDVFVRDRQTGTTERVSVGVSADGSRTQANESSYGRPSISSDGRFVVFSSWASNLVPYHDRIISDVFVHDRQTGTTKEMSVGPIWQETNGTSFAPSISSSGRYVAFFSTSSDLESGDTNNATDVFVRDRDTDADEVFDEAGAASTQRVRVDCAYSLCASHISRFVTSISSDGRYVTFPLPDSNLVAGDTNGVDDIFVHDRQMRATQRVNVHGCGTQANGGSLNPRISDDGRFVAFDSAASNLVAGDTNTFRDVFVRNLQGGTIQRVSVDSSGAQANGHSGSPSISSDGTYVVFSSGASNLVANDTNGLHDVFVRDRQEGTTERVSVSSC